MLPAPIPANESARLGALLGCAVLDTPADPALDALASLVAQLLRTPIALVSLVDADRQWFKARHGLQAAQTPRDVSFCGHVVAAGAALVVEDAFADPRFADNPLVLGDPRVRAYAGEPLRTHDGHVLGTLCAIDHVARHWTRDEVDTLRSVARHVETLLDQTRQAAFRQAAEREVGMVQGFFALSLDLLCVASFDGFFLRVNPEFERVLGYTEQELLNQPFFAFIHPDDMDSTLAEVGRLATGATTLGFQNRYRTKSGSWRWLNWRAAPAADRSVIYAVAHDVTDAMQDARERQRLAALHAAVLDAANASIIATDPDGVIQVFNATAEKWLGYRAVDVVNNMTPGPLHDGGEVVARANLLTQQLGRPVEPGFDAFVAKARMTREPDENDWTYVRKDGSRFPVRLSVTTICDAEGAVSGYLGVAQDLTRHKAAEQFADQLFHAAPNGLVVVDTHGQILSANAKAAQMFGYTQNQFAGMAIHALVPSRHRARHPALVAQYVDEREARAMGAGRDLPAVRADGSEFFVEVGLSPVETSQGPGVLAAVVDVTGRVEAARRTAVKVAVLHGLSHATSMDDAIRIALREICTGLGWQFGVFWSIDQAQQHLHATHQWTDTPRAQIEAATAEARFVPGIGLPGQCWQSADIVWSSDLAAAENAPCALVAVASGLQTLAAFPVIANSQVVAVVEVGATQVRSVDANIAAVLEAITTAIGQFLLRHRIEQDLVSARFAAERANSTKSLFLANMSHEIRTPMNAVLGLAHLAAATDLTHRQRDYVNKIALSARSLLGILNDILDFSKIEADKLRIEAAPFFLDDILGNLSAALSMLAGDKALEVVFDVPHDLPRYLVGDGLRLGQVLLNLCTNAVKFTQHGEIVVSMRARDTTDGELRLDCSVTDSGIGMSQDEMERLFQPFSQADVSTTRRYGGTGLGLSICKRLVELMGGEVSVTSTLGRGSKFAFFVQLCRDRAPRHRHSESQGVLPPGVRALVVDDSETARLVAQDMLVAWRMQVETAQDGAEALAAVAKATARGTPFDLVLLDWRMPRMDGLEVARRIHGSPDAGAELPRVVMMSAHVDDELPREAARAGVDRVIAKPFSASTLHDAVVDVVGVRRHGRALKPTTTAQDALTVLDGARVLVAEDNEINRQIVAELLEQAGVRVTCAVNGVEAVALATPNLDAVLMDLQMPVMDGFAATAALLARPDLRHIPIIAVTANAMVEDRKRVADAGMCDFVAKPIEPDLLFAALCRWVRGRGRTPSEPQRAFAVTPMATGDSNAARPVSIPALDGVDAAAALRRLGGNASLLLDLLERFRTAHRDAAERTDVQVRQGNVDEAIRTAHTLRGLAANLGALEVAQDAGDVEGALKAAMPAASAIGRLRLSLARVMRSLDEAAAASNPVGSAVATSPQASLVAHGDSTRFALLRDALALDDTAAGQMARALASQSADPVAAALREVANLADRYAFEDALRALNALTAGQK